MTTQAPSKIELGCGSHKRPGFFGIDIAQAPDVDLVLDIERQPLPFADDSVDHVYSSHAFEHLEAPGSPIQTLKEIVRVCRDGALIEIWTPYGKSDDGLLLGHRNFYTETHWKHICFMYDEFYLGTKPGRFVWEKTQYVLQQGIVETLAGLGIPLEFAIKHMVNIAFEFGVFLRLDKKALKAKSPQEPELEFGYERAKLLTPEQLAPSRRKIISARARRFATNALLGRR